MPKTSDHLVVRLQIENDNITEASIQAQAEHPAYQAEENTANATNDPVLGRYSRLETRALEFFEKTRQAPRKLKWSALDNNKFEELLANLGRPNDGMMVFLESYDREQLLKKQEITLMQVLQVSTKMDDLLSLLHSQESANAQYRQHLRSLEPPALSQTPNRFSCGRYSSQPVWVEWRYYEPHLGEGDDEEDDEDNEGSHEPPAFVHSRIARMAYLLRGKDKPREFYVPNYIDYVLDTKECRLGHVYKPITPVIEPMQPPVSLLDLLSLEKKKAFLDNPHSNGTAAGLLHLVPARHAMVAQGSVQPECCIRGIGGLHEWSKPTAIDETTERSMGNLWHGVYRHPDAQFDFPREGRRGFRKLYDIYSLGVVLYEIGVWRPVHALLGIDTDRFKPEFRFKASSVKTARSRLLAQESLDELEAQTGLLYAACVKSCLSGDFTAEDNGSREYGIESRTMSTADLSGTAAVRSECSTQTFELTAHNGKANWPPCFSTDGQDAGFDPSDGKAPIIIVNFNRMRRFCYSAKEASPG
ncbi:hypothetical protein PG993_005935 [Apiospora rasikravindrae]|uniref:Prion-inhibition and propagation HeLo domain-containing protein n=1 Tax=Apiospora rasikravindrae TaxID=990691 RepID=A0ABR1TBZ4_9PEZI